MRAVLAEADHHTWAILNALVYYGIHYPRSLPEAHTRISPERRKPHGILDGIVEWIAEQVMNILDLITTSVLGALGSSMDTFLRYFPAAETHVRCVLALALGLILLNWVWQLFKNYFRVPESKRRIP